MKLVENGSIVKFRKGETIYKKDFLLADHCVYLITDGEVELSRHYTITRKDSFILKKGELFGMLEVCTNSSRFTQAVAIGEVQAIGFSKVEFEKNVIGDLGFAVLNIRLMSKMLRALNDKIKELD